MADKEKRLTNELTIVGFIESISEIVERGDKGTEIITVRIKQPGKYENTFDIEFMNDKIDEVLELEDENNPGHPYDINLRVRIRASVGGRLWQPTKVAIGDVKVPDPDRKPILFLSIMGWSIKLDDEPIATKDRRGARRDARHGTSEQAEGKENAMPGDEMPTPEGDKSDKRKAKKAPTDPDAAIGEKDDLPY